MKYISRLAITVILCQIPFGFITQSVHATVLLKKDLQVLAKQAHIIVQGIVGTALSKWNEDKTRIHTYTNISITQVIEGDVGNKKSLIIKTMGGTIKEENIQVTVPGVPQFNEGDEVILFLQCKANDDTCHVVGWEQGKYDIKNGMVKSGAPTAYAYAGKKSGVESSTSTIKILNKTGLSPADSSAAVKEKGIPVSDFIKQIRELKKPVQIKE